MQVEAHRKVAGPRRGRFGGEAVLAAQVIAAGGEEQPAVMAAAEQRLIAVVAGLQPDVALVLVASAGYRGAARADAALGAQLGGVGGGQRDRKRAVWGKRVAMRVDLG